MSANGWRSAHDQPVFHQAQFLDVIWTGQRFIAVGFGGFYDSVDGESWQQQDASGDSTPRALAVGAGGVVAIGGTASWHSTDGTNWTTASHAFPTAFGNNDDVIVTDVIATATGWIAVGRDEPKCSVDCGTDPLRGLVWTSSDGLHWNRITGQAGLAPGGINAIAASGETLIAAGNADGRAAFWTSKDGTDWSRIPDGPTFGRPRGSLSSAIVLVAGVAALRGIFVAVGNAFEAGPAGDPIVLAWRSTDGRNWERATVEDAMGGQAFSVAATPFRFLATGPSALPSCRGGIWSSGDGVAWACDAPDEVFAGFGPYAAAASSSVEVAVGLTNVGYDENGSEGLPGAAFWRPAP